MANKKTTNQTITVKVNEENPEPLEVIAQSIIEVAEAFKKIQNSRLSKRVIVLLIKDMTRNIGINEIEAILDAVPKLESYYLKSVKK